MMMDNVLSWAILAILALSFGIVALFAYANKHEKKEYKTLDTHYKI